MKIKFRAVVLFISLFISSYALAESYNDTGMNGDGFSDTNEMNNDSNGFAQGLTGSETQEMGEQNAKDEAAAMNSTRSMSRDGETMGEEE